MHRSRSRSRRAHAARLAGPRRQIDGRNPAQGHRSPENVDGSRPTASGHRRHHHQQAASRRVLPEQRSEDGHQAAPRVGGGAREVRHPRSRRGGRGVRTGGGDPSRNLARLDRVQRGAAHEAEEGRIPDARSKDEGKKEVRAARGAGPVPVQQTREGESQPAPPAERGGVSWSRSR